MNRPGSSNSRGLPALRREASREQGGGTMPSAQQKTRGKERLYYIDLLETIAIVMVLSYHATNYSSDFLQGSEVFRHYLRYYIRGILSCCAPLFFFANGYLLFRCELDLKKHIRKILRFILLCFLWGGIDLFCLMFIRNEFLTFKEFLGGIWSWKSGWINHLWYLHTLIIIYLLFPLLKLAYDSRRDIFYFFLIVAAILSFGNRGINILATLGAQFTPEKLTFHRFNWFNAFNPFQGLNGYAFVYFCLGGIADELLDRLSILRKPPVSIAVLLLSMLGLFGVGVAYSHIMREIWDLVWEGYDTVFTLINVFCLFSLCRRYTGKNRALRQGFYLISSNTLGIYFVHMVIAQMLALVVMRYDITSVIPGHFVFVLSILALSLGISLLLRKNPLLKRLVS